MKEFKNKSGIYKITNTTNGKVYIGKTSCFYRRHTQYVSAFKNKDCKHINEYLLAAMIKSGFEKFVFSVVEFCDISECSQRELFWIKDYQSTDRHKGYNLRLDTETGMVVSHLTRQKISKRLKSEWSRGVRDSHSDKMKINWESRDRSQQSLVMTRNLTKYKYLVHFDHIIIDVQYKCLVDFGLKSVMSSFSRKKCDKVVFKGITIERVLV